MSETKRVKLEDNGELRSPIGRKPAKVATTVGLILTLCMIVVAWVLFIKYSL